MINLLDVIERYWSREEGRERTAHYPSDALDCRRKLFWRWTGEPETNPVDATGRWRMNIGTAIHSLVQRDMEAIAADSELSAEVAWEGFEVRSEVRTGEVWVDGSDRFGGRKLSRPIRGRVDMVFRDDEGVWCGGELKSKYGAGVRAMKGGEVEPRYLVQGAIYIVASVVGAEGEEPVRRYYFPIVSRDDGDRVQYVLQMVGDPPEATFELLRSWPGGDAELVRRFSFELFTKAVDRLAQVEGALDSGILPPRDFRVAIKNGEIKRDFQHNNERYKSDWQCLYCPFKDRCWGETVQEYASGNNAEMFEYYSQEKPGEREVAEAGDAAALAPAKDGENKPEKVVEAIKRVADDGDDREEL